jgi:hypothetical protein
MPNNFDFPFVLSVIGALIASFAVARLYIWPTHCSGAMLNLDRDTAGPAPEMIAVVRANQNNRGNLRHGHSHRSTDSRTTIFLHAAGRTAKAAG